MKTVETQTAWGKNRPYVGRMVIREVEPFCGIGDIFKPKADCSIHSPVHMLIQDMCNIEVNFLLKLVSHQVQSINN